VVVQPVALGGDRLFQLIDGGTVLIDERLVAGGPQGRGWRPVGGGGRPEDGPDDAPEDAMEAVGDSGTGTNGRVGEPA
jgi:hypothetical protein